jgi:acyl-CoA reductase-like NAD-dependent aldehyde dehydrogenase
MATREDMDLDLEVLAAASRELTDATPDFAHDLIYFLDACMAGLRAHAPEWVRVSCAAKGIPFDAPVAGEEWLAGPVVTMRNLRLLRETLAHYARTGRFRPGADVRTEDGRVFVRTFPTSRADAMLFSGFSATTHLLPGADPDVAAAIAAAYAAHRASAGVSLVLGAGNVSSIPVMDALYKIVAHGKACIVKMNPVNDYLTPVFEKIFRPLIVADLLSFVRGGAEEGAYLTRHPAVTDVHITGSDATHDLIVWGPSADRPLRKLSNDPVLGKPITSELGNVSPVMIVPGEYTQTELASMAWNVCSQVVNNGSFNCNAAKLLVLAKGWPQRDRFLDALRGCLAGIPARAAYYPGAHERFAGLVRFATRAEAVTGGELPRMWESPTDPIPWTLAYVDAADTMNPLFRQEPFCAMLSVTEIDGTEPEAFLMNATAFCNDVVWGTLNACIMIDPRTEKQHRAALDAAVRDLRYGTVGVNHWPALGYGFVSTPWGGHPSSTLADIRSGLGWVHNTYLLPDHLIEKTVIRGPLVVKPKPAWFTNNRMTHVIGRKLVDFEASPSPLKLPGIVLAALRG